MAEDRGRRWRTENRGQRSDLKPTQQPRGVAGVNAGLDDIFGNNGAGSDHDLTADRDRQDGGIGSDTDAVAKFSLSPELRLSCRSARHEEIVNKHRSVRNEAVVPNRDQIANERVGLDSAALSNLCPFLDFNERPDERLIADLTTV